MSGNENKFLLWFLVPDGRAPARAVFVVLVGIAAVATVGVCWYAWRSSGSSVTPGGELSSLPADNSESVDFCDTAIMDKLWIPGGKSPASPSIAFGNNPMPNGPDLTTPQAAVFSALTLINRDATDQLSQCFVAEVADPDAYLYPRYLGDPIELVDVVEEGESAAVQWSAVVHTEFFWAGQNRSPGERLTLTTRLIRVNGVWNLVKLDE